MTDVLNQSSSGRWWGRTLETSGSLETLLNDVGATLANSFVKLVEHSDSCLPINTSVCNTDTVLETTRALVRNILTASIDVRLDHDTGNASITCSELRANVIYDLGLIVVVLLRVTVW
jgi:hypothetical protein